MSYCVKCKAKTTTINPLEITSHNNRRMIKGECVICGKNKSSFVPQVH